MDAALFIEPGKPALLVQGIVSVQRDSCGNIGSVLVLGLERLFHGGCLDQIQKIVVIDFGIIRNGIDGFIDGCFNRLHFFDSFLNELLLHVQRFQKEVLVAGSYREFFDIIQRKTQVLEQKNLLQFCQIRIGIETGTGRRTERRGQQTLCIIIADGSEGDIRFSGKFTGGIAAFFLHIVIVSVLVVENVVNVEKDWRIVIDDNLQIRNGT